MNIKQFRFDGSKPLNLKKQETNQKQDKSKRAEFLKIQKKQISRLSTIQEQLYAEKKEGIVIVIQALDAGGKDSLIKHVMTGLNPQGVHVHSFKAPTSEELSHDYLWRIHRRIPARGEIAVFNRSHYEDVIAVQVRGYHKAYVMADRIKKESDQDFFAKRCRQISNFEEYLYENSYRVIKVFLNVSAKEQKKRFLERIDRPEKNWKFNVEDLDDRALFGRYLETFEHVINQTATHHSPWYVLPADQKWYTRYLFSSLLLEELEKCGAAFPQVSKEDQSKLQLCKQRLEQE